MGRNRKQYPDAPAPKVQRVMTQFGVTPAQAYSFWRRYAYHLVDRDGDARKAMARACAEKWPASDNLNIIRFFASLSLADITVEFFKELEAHGK